MNTIKKYKYLTYFVPGVVILFLGMLAIHNSVRLSVEHEALQIHHQIHETAVENMSAEIGFLNKARHSFERIQERENFLYWLLIAMGMTAFILLVLNADKLRKLDIAGEEKKKTMALLEQRLAAIEVSADGVVIVSGEGILTYMNRAFMDLHGILPQDVKSYIGQSWLDLYSSDGSDYISEHILPEFEGKPIWRGLFEIACEERGMAKIELSLARLKDEGFIGTFRDITAQIDADEAKQKMQEQLTQAQKMEAVGRLAGGIAHDFNNILAAMNGYAEFLIEDLKKESTEQGFAKNILQAGHQARTLVDEILAFSRRSDEVTSQLDLCMPLREALSMLQASLPKTVEVNVDLCRKENAFIHGNSTQIQQAVMNLCVNAKDAMSEERGQINITLSEVDTGNGDIPAEFMIDNLPDPQQVPLTRMEDGIEGQTLLYVGGISKKHDYIKLRIEDTGSGMNRMVMEHIFEPFFTTKSVDKGTGLGLSSVHGIVTGHCGAMIIESVLKQGTVFELFFPAIDVAEEIEEKALQDIDDIEYSGSILVVDDQDEVRMITAMMLDRKGYEVESVNSALEALDIMREQPGKFDLVITDQNMPKMTGLELVQEVGYDFPDFPFILLSGYSKEKMEDLMRKNPSVKAVLRKPVSKDVLAQKVAETLINKSLLETES